MKTILYALTLSMWILSAIPSQAEVVLDGSLGTSGALPGPDYLIQPEFGQQQGVNLFHSFSDFNLNSTESATFTGPAVIDNVIARVTGGNPSSIDGTIRSTIETADLYMINPNGLVFGENAWLDVNGSVHLSTAQQLKFADGTEFNTTSAEQPLLTTAAPSAFGFLSTTPAPISFDKTIVGVAFGETLSVIGGDIQVDGRISRDGSSTIVDTARLDAQGGRLNIAALGSAGEVSIAVDDLVMTGQGGDVSLNTSRLSAQSGGSIFIRAARLSLDNISQISNSTNDISGLKIDGQLIDAKVDELLMQGGSSIVSSAFATGQGGDIHINATQSATLQGEHPFTGAATFMGVNSIGQTIDAGSGGNLTIETPVLRLRNGGSLSAVSVGPGAAGKIAIAANQVEIIGENNVAFNSQINTNTLSSGAGGTIEIIADSLTLKDGGTILSQAVRNAEGSANLATGQGGNITLQISGKIQMQGQGFNGATSISSVTAALGNSGEIIIRAGELHLQDGAQITAAALDVGDAGNIDIEVTGAILVEGENSIFSPSFIGSSTEGDRLNVAELRAGLGGNAGNIRIAAQNITLRNGGQIIADTLVGQAANPSQGITGNGRAGEIAITTETLDIFGEPTVTGKNVSGIYAGSYLRQDNVETAGGDGGTITITSSELNLQNGGLISTRSESPGTGGDITIQTDNLKLSQNSKITAESLRTGDAGDVLIQTQGGFELNEGFIRTAAEVADGGNITIVAPHYIYLENSEVSTSVKSGVGQGGNIDLQPEFIVQKNSPILARAFGGPGGNINILTRSIYVFLPQDTSPIDASSALSEDGIITIESPDGTMDEDVVILVSDFIDASTLLKSLCSVEAAQNTSSFVVNQREGMPNNQSDLLPANPLFTQLPGMQISSNTPNQPSQPAQMQAGNPFFMGIVVADAGNHTNPRKGLWFGCSKEA